MAIALQDYREAAGRELSQFYAEKKIDHTDIDAKIAALYTYLRPHNGMLITSAYETERELRALQYLYLMRHGFDE